MSPTTKSVNSLERNMIQAAAIPMIQDATITPLRPKASARAPRRYVGDGQRQPGGSEDGANLHRVGPQLLNVEWLKVEEHPLPHSPDEEREGHQAKIAAHRLTRPMKSAAASNTWLREAPRGSTWLLWGMESMALSPAGSAS